jgi:HK97 family phage portal protein
MIQFLSRLFSRLFGRGKAMPHSLAGGNWTGTNFVDSYKRNRSPTANELLAELKGTAWTCATINAAACANAPPSLYVVTKHNQPGPKCATRPVAGVVEKRLRADPRLEFYTKAAEHIEEVTAHPVLDLINAPNSFMGSFDLWELTTLYQEVHGSAYWFLDLDPLLGIPAGVWLLPSQNVTPGRHPDSPNPVDFFRYRTGKSEQLFSPQEIIHFRYPDPKDPYTSGLSPLRACYEQVALTSDYAAFKKAKFENHAVPDALVTPDEVIGEEERDRLETQWNQRFRRGGSGRVVVAESAMKVQLLNFSMGDLAALAEMGATKELICNAFHVPIAYFTSNTNLANLIGSRSLHSEQAIGPRLERRDERLNAQLLPLYDPTGRLFFDSENPTPVDSESQLAEKELDLKYGVVSINEYRAGRGLPPAPWGEVPWLPTRLAPTSVPRTGAEAGLKPEE